MNDNLQYITRLRRAGGMALDSIKQTRVFSSLSRSQLSWPGAHSLINLFNMDDYTRRWLSDVLALVGVVAVGISKL
jgi:hypothetical protein